MEEKKMTEDEIIDNVKKITYNIINYSCILILPQKILKIVKLVQ